MPLKTEWDKYQDEDRKDVKTKFNKFNEAVDGTALTIESRVSKLEESNINIKEDIHWIHYELFGAIAIAVIIAGIVKWLKL